MGNQDEGERKLPDWYTKPLPWWLDFWYPFAVLCLFAGLVGCIALLIYSLFG